jgi:hypothetical protein
LAALSNDSSNRTERDRLEGLQAQLANQGIAPGTEAYNRAMTLQGQKEND